MSLLLKIKPGVPMKMDANDNPTFDQWMDRIDRVISKYRGISVYDLEDCPFTEWYDNRIRPIKAANKALKRAGADFF